MLRPNMREINSRRGSLAVSKVAHQVPVAQDGDPVADPVDLIKKVGDEHDADALLFEAAHHVKDWLVSFTSKLEVGSSRISI